MACSRVAACFMFILWSLQRGQGDRGLEWTKGCCTRIARPENVVNTNVRDGIVCAKGSVLDVRIPETLKVPVDK